MGKRQFDRFIILAGNVVFNEEAFKIKQKIQPSPVLCFFVSDKITLPISKQHKVLFKWQILLPFFFIAKEKYPLEIID